MELTPPHVENGDRLRVLEVRGLHLAGMCLALSLVGCASNITTPLPDLPKTHASSALSPQDRQKAVDELTKARDSSEQDAEKQIEQSR